MKKSAKNNVKSKKDTKDLSKINKILKNKKFRRILIAAIAAILCVTTLLLVICCEPKHPIEKFAFKIIRKQNCQVDIAVYGVPLIGGFALSLEIDGRVVHVPDSGFVEETYFETAGDKKYTYTKDKSGNWTKAESENNSSTEFLDEKSLKELINPENYELVEGSENVYRQKADVQFEKFKKVTITLADDSCTVDAITYYNDWALETKIVISNIGKMDVTLPRVG